ncbi:hypothetical protein IF1G_04532 [Cordyceps javanica]|uniref:Uncharacterized protein n=1 Tax=Cordyceps javanica TaxID=43265 RepID=A0A545V6F9_9HYPO|nr:hypothetical protein IF1G_04532 [Cordyceps javanica]
MRLWQYCPLRNNAKLHWVTSRLLGSFERERIARNRRLWGEPHTHKCVNLLIERRESGEYLAAWSFTSENSIAGTVTPGFGDQAQRAHSTCLGMLASLTPRFFMNHCTRKWRKKRVPIQ